MRTFATLAGASIVLGVIAFASGSTTLSQAPEKNVAPNSCAISCPPETCTSIFAMVTRMLLMASAGWSVTLISRVPEPSVP